MVNKVIYNGQIVDGDKGVIPIGNRGYLYADGLFESIRIMNGCPIFVDNHFLRIKEGMKALKIVIPQDFNFNEIEAGIYSLIALNGITEGARCRLTITRKAEGFYKPKEENGFDYAIHIIPMEINQFELNEKGLNIDIYKEQSKMITNVANYKTLNCHLYIIAAQSCKESNLDDMLLTNEEDHIIESTNSNIFIVSNSVIYTAPLSDGCVGGTMRMQIVNLALANNIRIYETSFKPRNLLIADEVFLTNAISGIQWVYNYREKLYGNSMSNKLTGLLNKSI